MNTVDRRLYIVDNPKVAVIELESILDIISFADRESFEKNDATCKSLYETS